MKRGISLIEILIAAGVAALSFGVFLSVFSKSYEAAELTRDQNIATIMARSWVAEIDAHPYGARPPASWGDARGVDERPATVRVAGHDLDVVFHRVISYENKSFIGDDDGTNKADAVTITITWSEKSGPKKLVVKVPVWK